MLKRIALAFLMFVGLISFSNAQAENEAATTNQPKAVHGKDDADDVSGTFQITGEFTARGWYGSESNGADMDDDGTKIQFIYRFTKYSGVSVGMESDHDVSNESDRATMNMNGTYAYFDLLRELGVKEVGMLIQVGAFVIGERVATKGAFGAGDDRITADDTSVDALNGYIEFNVSKEIVPLFIKVGGDLDFGYHGSNGDGDQTGASFNNNGVGAMFEVALMEYKVHENLSMNFVLTGNMKQENNDDGSSVSDDNLATSNGGYPNSAIDNPDYKITGGIGFDVLNMPRNMFMHIGGVMNYWTRNSATGGGWDQSSAEGSFQDGVDAQAVVRLGNQHVDFGTAWVMDNEYNFGHWIGMDIKVISHKVFQPYAGFGFRPDSNANYQTGGPAKYLDFKDRYGVEVGLKIIPTDNLSFSLGWNKSGDEVAGSDMTDNYATNDGGDIDSPTKQGGWGSIYVKVKAFF